MLSGQLLGFNVVRMLLGMFATLLSNTVAVVPTGETGIVSQVTPAHISMNSVLEDVVMVSG